MTPQKREIRVDAIWRTDGQIVPVKIYHKGLAYDVEVQKIIPLVATKKGGIGFRYCVQIDGKPHELYYEHNISYTARQLWYEYRSSRGFEGQ